MIRIECKNAPRRNRAFIRSMPAAEKASFPSGAKPLPQYARHRRHLYGESPEWGLASAVDRPWKRRFLGFSFLPDREATIRLAPKTVERFKSRIRELTSGTRPVSMDQRIRELNQYMVGWIGHFRLASAKTHCTTFDQWIRRRLRMCLWKQWKRVRTRQRVTPGVECAGILRPYHG